VTPSRLQADYDAWHARRGGAADRVDPRERRFLEWALGLLSPAHGATLLDVAGGQGACLAVASEWGLRVFGTDLSGVALGRARERVAVPRVLLSDAEQLPFADGAFDHVTCLGSLEHFPSPEAGAREIARVLAPRGRALVFVPNLYFIGHVYFGLRYGIQPSEGDQQFSESFLTSRGWQELLERAGLSVASVHPWNHIWATRKVAPVVMAAWNALSRFVPVHAAYAFAFVCERGV
jgi:SAM-dependent methyltransferase